MIVVLNAAMQEEIVANRIVRGHEDIMEFAFFGHNVLLDGLRPIHPYVFLHVEADIED